jgi:hypothetical protein
MPMWTCVEHTSVLSNVPEAVEPVHRRLALPPSAHRAGRAGAGAAQRSVRPSAGGG